MIRNILAISLVAVLALGCGSGGGGSRMPQQPAMMPDADNLSQLNSDALLLMSDMYLYGRDEQGKTVNFTIDAHLFSRWLRGEQCAIEVFRAIYHRRLS